MERLSIIQEEIIQHREEIADLKREINSREELIFDLKKEAHDLLKEQKESK